VWCNFCYNVLIWGSSVVPSAWSLDRNSSTVCSQWHRQCHWQPVNCRSTVTRPQFCVWHHRPQHVTVSTQSVVWCLRFCAVVVSVLSVWEDSEFLCECGIVWSSGGKLQFATGVCTWAHSVHLLHGGRQYSFPPSQSQTSFVRWRQTGLRRCAGSWC